MKAPLYVFNEPGKAPRFCFVDTDSCEHGMVLVRFLGDWKPDESSVVALLEEWSHGPSDDYDGPEYYSESGFC